MTRHLTIASMRARWRRGIKSKPTYPAKEYAKRIEVHRATLGKYLGQFGGWLSIWAVRNPGNLRIAESVFGRDRLETIISGDERPRVSDVFKMYEAYDFNREFMQYFLGKTHLSFELDHRPSPRDQSRNTQNGPYYSKLAEFVFIILSEYIVLHNYQFVSKKKGKGIQTIDRWLQ